MDKTKVVGVTYDGRQDNIKNINDMIDELIAVREPENPYDANAIHIYIKRDDDQMQSCGYINRYLAKTLAPEMDNGKNLKIYNYYVMGNGKDTPMGVMVEYELI